MKKTSSRLKRVFSCHHTSAWRYYPTARCCWVSFCPRMDSLVSVPAMVFSHFSITAPTRGQAGLGFLDMLYCGAHIAREIAISGDSATTSSRSVSAIWICYVFLVRLSNGLNEHVLHTLSGITPTKNTQGTCFIGRK